MTTTNRETWLNQLATLMAPKFQELGHPLPAFRVSIGFTSAGRSKKVGGECWHKKHSADGRFEILITPIIDTPMEVAAILAHELTHAAVGFNHGHGGQFAKTVAQLGLQRPYTASVPGDAFRAWVQPFLDQLGALPHARIMFEAQQQAEGAEGEQDQEGERGSSNAKPKQATRMLKASCTHDGCGYTVRLSKKWALKLGAVCPEHGTLDIEGLEDCEPEDAE